MPEKIVTPPKSYHVELSGDQLSLLIALARARAMRLDSQLKSSAVVSLRGAPSADEQRELEIATTTLGKLLNAR